MDSQIYGCPFATKQLINVSNDNPNVCVKMKIGIQTIQLKCQQMLWKKMYKRQYGIIKIYRSLMDKSQYP